MSRSAIVVIFLCLTSAAQAAAQESSVETVAPVGFADDESQTPIDGQPGDLRLVEKLYPLIAEEAELRNYFGANHPRLLSLQKQIQATHAFFAALSDSVDQDAENGESRVDPQLAERLYPLVVQEAALREKVGPDHPRLRALQRQIHATRGAFVSATQPVTDDARAAGIAHVPVEERRDEAQPDRRQARRQESEQIERHAAELRRRLDSVENPDERREVSEQLRRLEQERQKLQRQSEPKDRHNEAGEDRDGEYQRLNELRRHQAELNEQLEALDRQDSKDAQARAGHLRERLVDILHARRDLEQRLAEIHRNENQRRAEHQHRDDHDHEAHEHRGEQQHHDAGEHHQHNIDAHHEHHDGHEHRVREEEHRRQKREPGNIEEGIRRVRAMHEAAERLGSAGLHDMAEELHDRAEELEREVHGHQGRSNPDQRLNEILENVHQLRHEVRQLHEKLEEVLNRLNSERNRR